MLLLPREAAVQRNLRRLPPDSCREILVLYRKRTGDDSFGWRAGRAGSLSIQRFERSRPRLRRMRGLCHFNRPGEGACGRQPSFQSTLRRAEVAVETRSGPEAYPNQGRWHAACACFFPRRTGRVTAPEHMVLWTCEQFHWTSTALSGGARIRICAAVKRSTTTIGPPQDGHVHRATA
jgi:hypothetical protein